MQDVLKKYFQFDEYETTFKKEIIAGTTNFLTMAYILGVNTIILHSAGMDFNSVFLATAISSAIACFVMGIIANAPLGLAPGMGSNSFFYIYCCKIIWLFLSRGIGYGFCFRVIIFTSFCNWYNRQNY